MISMMEGRGIYDARGASVDMYDMLEWAATRIIYSLPFLYLMVIAGLVQGPRQGLVSPVAVRALESASTAHVHRHYALAGRSV